MVCLSYISVSCDLLCSGQDESMSGIFIFPSCVHIYKKLKFQSLIFVVTPLFSHILFPAPSSPAVLGGVLSLCKPQYKTVWEEVEEEKVVQECKTVTENVCKRMEKKNCTLDYKRTCSVKTNKVCTLKPIRCVSDLKSVVRDMNCKPKTQRKCDYRWHEKGDAEILEEIPESCKHIDTGEQECSYKIGNIEKKRVCKKRPTRVCEWRQIPVDCKEKPGNICSVKDETVCEDQPTKRCEDVLKKQKMRISKKVPETVCR